MKKLCRPNFSVLSSLGFLELIEFYPCGTGGHPELAGQLSQVRLRFWIKKQQDQEFDPGFGFDLTGQ